MYQKQRFIDPPYNTGEAFEYYDDNLEHSIWLNLMYARLQILRNLLADDGFFCCQIDDSEGHYLKTLLDEVFGHDNYQTTIYVRVRYPEETLKQDIANTKKLNRFIYTEKLLLRIHEETKSHIEVYARSNDKPIVKPFVLVVARDTDHSKPTFLLIVQIMVLVMNPHL